MHVDAGRPPQAGQPPGDLVELLKRKVVGQTSALQYITPYIQMYQAGLNPVDRPAGIFLLLGHKILPFVSVRTIDRGEL